MSVSEKLEKLLNAGTAKMDSKLTILHGLNAIEFAKTLIVLTVQIVHHYARPVSMDMLLRKYLTTKTNVLK